MRASRWSVLCALGLVGAFLACGTKSHTLAGGDDSSPETISDGGSSSSGGGSSSGSSGGGPVGVFQMQDAGIMLAESACKAGHYEGAFTGSYSSNLILGIPLSVMGNVNLTLNQAGTTGMTCMVEGEGFVTCSDVFTLSGGTITGVANELAMVGDANVGGFPYYCTMTGTLDCPKKKLLNGWIQCTYCVGDLTDGGTGCTLIGGHFAGPLTSDYIYGNDAGVGASFGTDASPAQWNGAEALAGNDGTKPPPDGGTINDYLSFDGGYGIGFYGGSGTWTATYQK
jgi:hypothetical protein